MARSYRVGPAVILIADNLSDPSSEWTELAYMKEGVRVGRFHSRAARGRVDQYGPVATAEGIAYAPAPITVSASCTEHEAQRIALLLQGDYTSQWVRAAGNLITEPEEFDHANWSKNQCSISADVLIAPDGVLLADKLAQTSGIDHYMLHSFSMATGDLVASCFGRWVEGNNEWLDMSIAGDGGSNGFKGWFNIRTGKVGTATTFGAGYSTPTLSIEHYGEGWFRCIMQGDMTANSSPVIVLRTTDADAVTTSPIGGSMYFFGAHVKAGTVTPDYFVGDQLREAVALPSKVRAKSIKAIAVVPFMEYELGSKSWAGAEHPLFMSHAYITIQQLRVSNVIDAQGDLHTYQIVIRRAMKNDDSSIAGYGQPSMLGVESQSIQFDWKPLWDGIEPAICAGRDVAVFNRNFSGRYHDQSGIVRSKGDDVLRIHQYGVPVVTAGHNTCMQSSIFDDAVWNKYECSVAGGYTSPVGGSNGFKITESGTTDAHGVVDGISGRYMAGKLMTHSCYAKAGTRNLVFLQFNDNSSNSINTWFDLTAGTVLTEASGGGVTDRASGIVDVGNGWYRIWHQCRYPKDAGVEQWHKVYLTDTDGVISYNGDGVSYAYIAGMQVEESGVLGPYVDVPDSSPPVLMAEPTWVDGQCGALMEQGRTNLSLWNITPGANSNWSTTTSRGSFDVGTTGVAIAPDGAMEGSKLVADATAADTHGSTHNRITATVAEKYYTFSIYAKQAEIRYFGIRINNEAVSVTEGAEAIFDLELGIVEKSRVVWAGGGCSLVQTQIEECAFGWYRCQITILFSATSDADLFTALYLYDGPEYADINWDGDSESGLFLWGAQAEEGSPATSMITTGASTVLRNNDIIQMAHQWAYSAEQGFTLLVQIHRLWEDLNVDPSGWVIVYGDYPNTAAGEWAIAMTYNSDRRAGINMEVDGAAAIQLVGGIRYEDIDAVNPRDIELMVTFDEDEPAWRGHVQHKDGELAFTTAAQELEDGDLLALTPGGFGFQTISNPPSIVIRQIIAVKGVLTWDQMQNLKR